VAEFAYFVAWLAVMSEGRAEHWQNVYRTKEPTAVSWFRPHLEVSLELIKQTGVNANSCIIDVGAGASTLVDDLLKLGFLHLTAFDISATSLDVAKQRLGTRANAVRWIVGDVASHRFPRNGFDVWHDRAVLHFLVASHDVQCYVENATTSIVNGGHVVIGCFASDGPEKCSGLPVTRRDPEDIAALFGASFTVIAARREQHMTPTQATQSFAYALLRKRA